MQRADGLIARQTRPALCHVLIGVVVTAKSERVDMVVVGGKRE